MEVKPGYKQSEVGVIPEEWDSTPFSDLFEFRNGVNAEKQAYGHGIRFINVLEVITQGHLRAADITGRVTLSKAAIDAYAVHQGDLVFNRTSETQEEVGLASVYLDDEPVVFGGFVIRGRPKRAVLDPSYSGYALRARAIRTQIIAKGQGAIHANVGQADLRRVYSPIPPLLEQRAIAAALSDVDALIGGLEKLIAKKRNLKEAAMQQFLTGQLRLPGFHGEWEACQVRDVSDVKTGPFGSSLHERDYVDDGIPIITVEHLDEFGVSHSNVPMVSGADWQRLKAYALDENDIVFSRVGSIDRNALVRSSESGWLFSGRLLRVRPDQKRVFAPFLSYHFHTEPFKQRVRSVAVGQTMASLNTQILKGIDVHLPPLVEQIAVASVLSDMDVEIAALEQRGDKARNLKQGMMQELLTGRTRLV